MRNCKRFSFIILLLCLPVWASAHVKGIPSREPITIESDSVSVEQLKQQAHYDGNVVMVQGAHQLQADKLTINRDAKGRIDVITATGQPARFNGIRPNDPNPLVATAKIIYYYPEKQLILLEGSAQLEHQHDTFKGPSLRYQLDKQVISATSLQQERPTITINPRS